MSDTLQLPGAVGRDLADGGGFSGIKGNDRNQWYVFSKILL